MLPSAASSAPPRWTDHPAARFAAILAGGLVVSLGRFDWSAPAESNLRPWALSAYLFAVLLAGPLALGLRRRLGRPGWSRLALGLPILACAVLANLDAFGLVPYLYFRFYFNSGGFFS